MIIQPYIFDLLFYTTLLLIGLDFAISGWLVIIKGKRLLEKPRSLGVMAMRYMDRLYKNLDSPSRISSILYSLENTRFYVFVGGILAIAGNTLGILNVLQKIN